MRAPASTADLRTRGGFSLLEVTIVLGLLGVGMLSLAVMQLQALRGGRSGTADTYATTVAQDRMELLQRLRWTSMAPTAGWTAPVTVSHSTNGQDYAVSWRITDVVANWTRAVDVQVSWDAPGRPGRTRFLSSVRYNREGL
jgi:prepilin-type N-terminal cleavage/methylation domain-containing protein